MIFIKFFSRTRTTKQNLAVDISVKNTCSLSYQSTNQIYNGRLAAKKMTYRFVSNFRDM